MAGTMLPLNFITKRHGLTLNFRLSQHVFPHKRCFSTKKDSNNEDSTPKEVSKDSALDPSQETKSNTQTLSKEETKEEAKKKLFSLLSELKVDSFRQQSNLYLAKAVKRPLKKERFSDILAQKEKSPEEKMEIAVKAVAESIRGDPKETLSELNEKLRILNLGKDSTIDFEKDAESLHGDSKETQSGLNETLQTLNLGKDSPIDIEDIQDTIIDKESSKNIMLSVEEVAAAVTDSPPLKNSLSERLLRLSDESKSSEMPRKSIDDLIKSMKVDTHKVQTRKEVREQPEHRSANSQRRQPSRPILQKKFNIFEAPPLDFFPIPVETVTDAKKTVWQSLEEKQLKLLVQFAPANGFEEMIMWTEQGKHWKFPIDNETEMGEEENVGFNEHVFLEQHLHGFPTKGPIRHFMELVTVGLSKNPYITVDRKIENINWFRDYFKEKEDILKETGALG